MKREKRVLGIAIIMAAVCVFSANAQARNIFIEGTATIAAHQRYFLENFRMEAEGLGFTPVNNRANSEFTFRFEVQPHDPSQFIIRVHLIQNSDNSRLVSHARFFTNLEEMNEYNQFMFFQAIILIPAPEIIPPETGELARIIQYDEAGFDPEIDNWRNKLLYLRFSVDYPITFYTLKPDGLFGGTSVYEGPISGPNYFSILDHKYTALPGATAGIEAQLLDFLSLGALFKVSLAGSDSFTDFNMSAGAEIKFPLKFLRDVNLEPYGLFLYHLRTSDKYSAFPAFSFGGGLQVSMKGGKAGAFFVDLHYITSLSDAVLKNPYGEIFPNPGGIHYSHSAIGLGIGYKFGIIDRNRADREPRPPREPREREPRPPREPRNRRGN